MRDVPGRATLHLVEDVKALARDLVMFLETSPSSRGDAEGLQARVRAAIGQSQDGATAGRALLTLLLARALAARPSTLLKDLRWLETLDEQFEMRVGTTKLPLDFLL